MKTTLGFSLILGVIAFANQTASSASAERVPYSIDEINDSSGDDTTAVDINDLGQVAMFITNPSGQNDVYLWEDGTLTNLAIDSTPVSINNLGQVVGVANYNGRVMIWEVGLVILTNLPYTPTEINDNGYYVDYHAIRYDRIRAGFFSLDNYWSALPVLHDHDSTEALGINNSNVVTGWSTASNSKITLAVFQQSAIQVIGGFSYDMTAGYAINDANIIVGAGMNYIDSIHHAFTYNVETGERALINIRGDSIPVDINSAGDVVLMVDGVPTLWSQGVSTPLSLLARGDSDWELTTVTAINDDGWIVGTGYLNGNQRGYLLKPQVGLDPVRRRQR